jgi:hypothetical protein
LTLLLKLRCSPMPPRAPSGLRVSAATPLL